MKVHLTKEENIGGSNKNTVTYPRLGFAFNPIAVRVKVDAKTSVSMKVAKEGETPITITRESYKNGLSNEVIFDLSAIARSQFDKSEFHKIGEVEKEKEDGSPSLGIGKVYSILKDSTLYKKMVCEVFVGNDSVLFNIPVIWGAMQIGETYTQSKNLKMFKGYPFTVPFFFSYLNAKDQENLDKNKKAQFFVKRDSEDYYTNLISEGKHILKIGSALVPERRLSLWVDNSENDSFITTFDMTFDYTFRGLSDTSFVMNVDVLDTCGDEGYYLRWINAYGEYCYWLFKLQVESTVVENKGIEFDQYYTTVNFTENYHVGTGKSVGKKVKKTIQLFADFVDSADFDFLMGLVQSPVVDLYMGKTNGTDKWVSVNIQPATFPKGKEHLQDFSFVLELPQPQLQSL